MTKRMRYMLACSLALLPGLTNLGCNPPDEAELTEVREVAAALESKDKWTVERGWRAVTKMSTLRAKELYKYVSEHGSGAAKANLLESIDDKLYFSLDEQFRFAAYEYRLSEEDDAIKLLGVEAFLNNTRDPLTRALLPSLISHGDKCPMFQRAVIRLVFLYPTAEVTPAIIELLRSESSSEELKLLCMGVMTDLADLSPQAREIITKEYWENSIFSKTSLLFSFALSNTISMVGLIAAEAATSKDKEVASRARYYLSEYVDSRVLREIAHQLNSENPAVRRLAHEKLVEMTSVKLPADADKWLAWYYCNEDYLGYVRETRSFETFSPWRMCRGGYDLHRTYGIRPKDLAQNPEERPAAFLEWFARNRRWILQEKEKYRFHVTSPEAFLDLLNSDKDDTVATAAKRFQEWFGMDAEWTVEVSMFETTKFKKSLEKWVRERMPYMEVRYRWGSANVTIVGAPALQWRLLPTLKVNEEARSAGVPVYLWHTMPVELREKWASFSKGDKEAHLARLQKDYKARIALDLEAWQNQVPERLWRLMPHATRTKWKDLSDGEKKQLTSEAEKKLLNQE